jgi:hypothetical protein
VRRISQSTIFATLIHRSLDDSANESSFWNELCRLQNVNSVFHIHFDNYRWRESLLQSWSFFEYFMLIQLISARNVLSTDIFFEENHFACNRYVQRLKEKKERIRIISFVDSLSLQ